jgi:hypothetical protein
MTGDPRHAMVVGISVPWTSWSSTSVARVRRDAPGRSGRRGITDLAAFLGLTLRQLAALSVERRPLTRSKQGIWSPGSAIDALAEAHGADNHRLFEAVADRPADT